MWGRFWTYLYPLSIPYPDRTDVDVSAAMVDQVSFSWQSVYMYIHTYLYCTNIHLNFRAGMRLDFSKKQRRSLCL